VGTQVTALLTSTSLSVTARVHTGLSLPVPPPSSGAADQAPWKLAGGADKPIIGVLTVSDRASRGVYEDVSGPLIGEVLREYLATECHYMTRMVPDEISDIVAALREMVAAGCALVCTTGGTGPAARDVTPEAMALVCNKTYDGFGEAMRRASQDAGVPTAILSRQSAASVGKTLVINLPGKPQAIRTCLDAVFPAGPASSLSFLLHLQFLATRARACANRAQLHDNSTCLATRELLVLLRVLACVESKCQRAREATSVSIDSCRLLLYTCM